MNTKSKDQYEQDITDEVYQILLDIARCAGVEMKSIVVIGGLVSSLLIPQTNKNITEDDDSRHIGTSDLDLVLSRDLLDAKRYSSLASQLRQHQYESVSTIQNGKQHLKRWQWRRQNQGNFHQSILIEFLMPAVGDGERGRQTKFLEKDFAALEMDGLAIAFVDPVCISISGVLDGGDLTRDVYVCNPAAFLVLKVRAVQLRYEPKDAYDLFYMLKYYGDPKTGLQEIAQKLDDLCQQKEHAHFIRDAVVFVRSNLSSQNHEAVRRVALFLGLSAEDANAIHVEFAGYLQDLLKLLQHPDLQA